MKRAVPVLVVLVMLLVGSVAAQDKGYEYVVTLKSGITLRGVFIKKEPNGFLVLRNPEKGEITINTTEISFMQREEIPSNAPYALQNSGFESDMSFQIAPGLMIGMADESEGGFQLHASGFYNLNSTVSLGIGMGIERFNEATWLPLYGTLKIQSEGPFMALSMGYTSLIHDEYFLKKGGMMYNAEFGLRFPTGSENYFYVSASYRYQRAVSEEMVYALEYDGYGNEIYPYDDVYNFSQKFNLHFMVLSLGMIF